jgi:hypothetical protein
MVVAKINQIWLQTVPQLEIAFSATIFLKNVNHQKKNREPDGSHFEFGWFTVFIG